jgi:hypothetical protein
MKTRTLLLALAGCAIAAVTVAIVAPPQKLSPPTVVAATPSASTEILVYYFHATARCATCRKIEAYAKETVTTRFASDLEARRLEWQAVNVDEAANRHFIRDFGLYTRSVVIVDARHPKRFKVLDQTWQLVRDKEAFQKYVEQEIRAFRRS